MNGMDGSTPASMKAAAEHDIVTVMLPTHVDSSTSPAVERTMIEAVNPIAATPTGMRKMLIAIASRQAALQKPCDRPRSYPVPMDQRDNCVRSVGVFA